MGAVRPEFRAEVFRPARDDTVFVRGECRLANCPNVVGRSARGICDSHYKAVAADRVHSRVMVLKPR